MRVFAAVLSLLAATLAPGAVSAQATIPVDIELVLAVDVSRSMTEHELEIQRRGYAAALTSAEVIRAITGGIHGQIALLYLEWAGHRSQRVVVGWTLIRGLADAEAVAARLTADFDETLRRTSISGALDFAAKQFEGNGFDGLRRVIDVSGDGPNNDGRPVVPARDAAAAQGIIVNGLPLMTNEGVGSQWALPDLDRYYYHCVIAGPGAFVIPVREWQHFPAAVRQKLVLELAGTAPAAAPPPFLHRAQAEAYDCLIGEKIMQRLLGNSP
jgi:hypothetical protein